MGPAAGRSAAAWITRQAVRRGLLGSSRIWFAVFVSGSLAKLARRALRARQAPPAFSERLELGATIEVRHRRGVRALRRPPMTGGLLEPGARP